MQIIAMHCKACTRTGAKYKRSDRDTNLRSYCTHTIQLRDPCTQQILQLACLTACRPFKNSSFFILQNSTQNNFKILLWGTIIHAHCLFRSLPLIHAELLGRLWRFLSSRVSTQNYLNYCLLGKKKPCSLERQRERTRGTEGKQKSLTVIINIKDLSIHGIM
jgi:hypothetical protein